MVEQREINARGRMMATAAGLGGKHLQESNKELQALYEIYTTAQFNALLMAIRKHNESDRQGNDRLPILIFANCSGGLVPDSMVPIYEGEPPWTPAAPSFGKEPSKKRPSTQSASRGDFANEACISAPIAYVQPSSARAAAPPQNYFVMGPD